MGMVQRGDRARFALEPLPANRVARELRGQDLDRDVAHETRVVGAIDLAHAATAQRLDDLIGTEPGSFRERHVPARNYRSTADNDRGGYIRHWLATRSNTLSNPVVVNWTVTDAAL